MSNSSIPQPYYATTLSFKVPRNDFEAFLFPQPQKTFFLNNKERIDTHTIQIYTITQMCVHDIT